LSDDPTGTAASASETAAEEIALAGEWTTVNRDIPANGYYDSDFCMHAVQDLDGTSTTPAGTSIQRLNDEDRDNLSDWTDSQTASWGRNNLNQVNQ